MTRDPAGTMTGWVIRHRVAVLAAWLVLLVGGAGAAAAGASYSSGLSLPGTDSQRAADLLARDFPSQAGDLDLIVFHARSAPVTSSPFRPEIDRLLATMRGLPHVSGVVSPFTRAGSDGLARGGHTAFAAVSFDEAADELPAAAIRQVRDAVDAARSASLDVELGGAAVERLNTPALGQATAVALVAAVVILVLAFGSFLAMGLSLLTALLGLVPGIGAGILASHLVSTVNFATEVGIMIGLGVGIDYALFIVTRFREAYVASPEVEPAIRVAARTAGRAVAFAGTTVIVALLSLCVLGVSLLDGMAVAAALAVAFTMLAAVTALPALLSVAGRRIGQAALRRANGRGRPGGGSWFRWTRLIGRHRWLMLAASLVFLLALSAPALTLRLGNSDAGNDPPGTTTRAAYDLLASGFGAGFNGPLVLVAQSPRIDTAALTALTAAVRAVPGVASAASPAVSPDGTTATVQVFPRTAPQDEQTTSLVAALRQQVLPRVAATTGLRVLVGGPTAAGIDFSGTLSAKLPLFVTLIIVISALLLLVVFRSLVIPLQAALMNVLSISASLGVVVAVFQHGWLGGLIGVDPAPTPAFIPVVMFAIVFGLSMDYEIFLVSRIREEWTRSRDPQAAVVAGVGTTGRVISAAAVIMCCVFASFLSGADRGLKLFGLSFAVAVFLDAFVIRSLLLPAVLQLAGRFTWLLPPALGRRLPHVTIEAPMPDGP